MLRRGDSEPARWRDTEYVGDSSSERLICGPGVESIVTPVSGRCRRWPLLRIAAQVYKCPIALDSESRDSPIGGRSLCHDWLNTGYVVEPPAGDTPDPAAAPEVRKDGYLESLVKFIPAEAVALFLVFDNLIKSNAPEDGADPETRLVVLSIVLLFLCLALNVVYLAAAALASSRKIEANRGRSSSQRKKEAKKVWKDFGREERTGDRFGLGREG